MRHPKRPAGHATPKATARRRGNPTGFSSRFPPAPEPDDEELSWLNRRVDAEEAGGGPANTPDEDTTPTIRRRKASEEPGKGPRRRVLLAASILIPLVAVVLFAAYRGTHAEPVRPPRVPHSTSFGNFLRDEERAREEAYRRWAELPGGRAGKPSFFGSIGQAFRDFFRG